MFNGKENTYKSKIKNRSKKENKKYETNKYMDKRRLS